MLLLELPQWFYTVMNYPGLELWKFLNLAILLSFGIYVLRKPLQAALDGRRENISLEIAKAQAQRDKAAESLEATKVMLSGVDSDVAAIKEQSRQEAVLERQRQGAAAETEIKRLEALAVRELEIARKQAHKELQNLLANRSIELARESVLSQLRPEDDIQFIRDRISELRRSKA